MTRCNHKHIQTLEKNALIVDIGGGTGLFYKLWPSSSRYICIDNDDVKLKGFLNKHSDGKVLWADATQLPIKSISVDVVLCTSMSHHVPLDMLDALVRESARVLKPAGKFIFLDAVLIQERWLNRLLWKFDRGMYPHTEQEISSVFQKHCCVIHQECFNIYYDYVLIVAEKRSRINDFGLAASSRRFPLENKRKSVRTK